VGGGKWPMLSRSPLYTQPISAGAFAPVTHEEGDDLVASVRINHATDFSARSCDPTCLREKRANGSEIL
jgi:hypothetical protein